MRRLMWLLMVCSMIAPGVVVAQGTPESQPDSLLDYLFHPEELGPEWGENGPWRPAVLDGDVRAFEDGYGNIYGGPLGQRVQVIVLENKTDRASLNAGWSELNDWIDDVRYTRFTSFEYGRTNELNDGPIPEGFDDARRIDGYLTQFPYSICAGIYAIEPSVMIYVRVEFDIDRAVADGFDTHCDQIATMMID